MKKLLLKRVGMVLCLCMTAATATAAEPAPPAAPPVLLDTKPAFMQVVTNTTLLTNAIVVTNYVVVTRISFTTNLFNAAGQLLQPIPPALAGIPGAVAIPQSLPQPPPKPAAPGPDPAAIKADQLKAVRELLVQSLLSASNTLASAGYFADAKPHSVMMPAGVTSFDRKKGQAFLAAMNLAAEKAVPETVAIVAEALKKVSPTDPSAILKGAPDAATALLLSVEGQNISNQTLTIVQRTASDASVGAAYRGVMIKGGGLLGAVLGTGPAVDTDVHITKGLVAALFHEMTTQETKIRTDPAARKTKILQDAFPK